MRSNPDLQHSYGINFDNQKTQERSRKHFITKGYHQNRKIEQPKWEQPRYCADGDQGDLSDCHCKNGKVYFGLKNRLDNDKKIEDFETLRQFKTLIVTATGVTKTPCTSLEFSAKDFFKGKKT